MENLKENTEYHGYTKETPVIKWLWDILDTLDKQEKANFIQFVTGKFILNILPEYNELNTKYINLLIKIKIRDV